MTHKLTIEIEIDDSEKPIYSPRRLVLIEVGDITSQIQKLIEEYSEIKEVNGKTLNGSTYTFTYKKLNT
jgi:hypothetical protein